VRVIVYHLERWIYSEADFDPFVLCYMYVGVRTVYSETSTEPADVRLFVTGTIERTKNGINRNSQHHDVCQLLAVLLHPSITTVPK
jgi:hypothetical protein